MGLVIAEITISLDGFVTAPGAGPDAGLGVGGEDLHTWVFSGDPDERAILDRSFSRTGAVIMGRNLFDVVDGPAGWNDDLGYGAEQDQSAPAPCFVVTHHQPESVRLTDRMRIVTDGLQSALDQARAAAEAKDVVIMGGGAIIAAYLEAGLVDQLLLHIAPLALGGGTPLFDRPVTGLRLLTSTTTPNAVHVTYAVGDPA